MKVYIGPYLTWWGPYQIADLLQKIGVSKDRCYKIGKWLADTPVNSICQYIETLRNRTIKVRIDKYDTWSMDHTLAHIILPMLKQLKDAGHGSGSVKDEEVPDYLKSTTAPPKENEWDIDEFYHARWEWVMKEMIWSFEQIVDENSENQFYKESGDYHFQKLNDGSDCSELIWDKEPVINYEGLKKHKERISNGLRLFGIHYQSLWD